MIYLRSSDKYPLQLVLKELLVDANNSANSNVDLSVLASGESGDAVLYKQLTKYCTIMGMADEIVDMTDIRPYIQAFTEAVYQNPETICPFHQMVTPRAIREWNTTNGKA